MKSCAFLGPLLWLSCVKGFLCFVFLFFSLQGVLFSSLCLDRNLPDMMHLWSEIFNKYSTLGFVCLFVFLHVFWGSLFPFSPNLSLLLRHPTLGFLFITVSSTGFQFLNLSVPSFA